MANETQNLWQSATAITVTNLASLLDGDIWQSGLLEGSPAATRQRPGLRISYDLDWNAAPVAGDKIVFRIATGDEDGTEIWDGGVGETEGKITAAAAKDNIIDNIRPSKIVTMSAGNNTTGIKGSFDVYNVTPDWQLLVQVIGEGLAASGHTLRYRFFEPQGQ